MAAAIARHVGARHVVVTDVNDYRLALAKKLGASQAVNIKTASIGDVMRDLGMTEGFDVGMEMSGNVAGIHSMLDAMNHGGRVALLGLPSAEVSVDWNEIIFKGLILKGIYGREMFETWYKMVAMLQSGLDVTAVLTHRFPLAEFEKAFEVMRSGQSGKVILELA
jgi:threonine 3-dehydrogenase